MTSNSKPTVLVLGATSKIGRVLVQELHRTEDIQVVADLIRHPPRGR
jgi:NAD(P)-dependent dehydrogenase (short-subunit alcohol dehydrogenase family)